MRFGNNFTKYAVVLIPLILTLLIPLSAQAAPYIQGASGTFSNDRIIMITGSGFGEKLQAEPIRYDDFEGLPVGQTIGAATDWWEDGIGGSSTLRISDENQRSSFSSRNVVSKLNDNRAAYKNNIGFAKTGKIYVNLWLRMDWGSGDDSYQFKLWRVSTFIKPGHGSTYPDISFVGWTKNNFPAPGGYTKSYFINHYYNYHYNEPSSDIKIFWFPDNLRNIMTNEGWYNVALQVDQGDVGQSNGNIVASISHLPRTSAYEKLPLENHMVLDKVDSNIVDSILVGEKIVNGGTASMLYYDDIYIDNSWARIEIGDNPEYDKSTLREIQVLDSWSDNSISFRVHQGLLKNNDQAYVFVVDENGKVSNGFPIVISGEGGPSSCTPSCGSWSDSVNQCDSRTCKRGDCSTYVESKECPQPEPEVTFFSSVPFFGDSNNWIPNNPSYWDVLDQDGDLRYVMVESNLLYLDGKLPAYSLVKDKEYSDFVLKFKAKSPASLSDDNADNFAVVFGFQDDNNYYYALFNSRAEWNELFKVINGQRIAIASPNVELITDNKFHNFEISKQDDLIIIKRDGVIVMSANDDTFKIGKVGVGVLGISNDVTYFDDIEISSEDEQIDNFPGDINNDKKVNMFDILMIIKDFGKESGFDPIIDLNKDNKINLLDILEVVKNWGKTY